MDEVGRIDVLWMYPQINRVLGFVCKSGFLGSKKTAFKLPQLKSTGEDGVLVTGEGEPTVAAKVKQLESLIQSEVWTDSGEKIGYIIDCLFNYRSGVIVRYLMIPGRLASITDGVYFLPPKAIQSFGQNRVLISADIAENLKPYRKGWKYKLAEMRAAFKEEYVEEVTGDLRSFAQQMQVFSKEAMHTMETWGDRLRDETQGWVEQAKERGQALVEKAKTSGQTIFNRIRTEGVSFNEHIQDAVARTQSDVSQNVTFPHEEEESDSGTEDYDRETWDDDWNDWEEQQDSSASQDLDTEWDDDTDWEDAPERHQPDVGNSGVVENEWSDDQTEEVGEEVAALGETNEGDRPSVQNESVPHESVPHESVHNHHTAPDVWDDDWGDDNDDVSNSPDSVKDTPKKPNESASVLVDEDDTDPWV